MHRLSPVTLTPAKRQTVETVVPHSRPWITREDQDAVTAALSTSMIATGEVSRALETRAAGYLGQAGALATCDGTTALFLALLALKVTGGDEVVIPTYVCEAVAHAVRWTGASPVVCDIGDDWCINADTVRSRLTRRTKAVVVVHTFGIVADVRRIAELGLPVIEDMAQAFGAGSADGRAGSFGDLSMTSLHATKCWTTGEGGMVFAREARLFGALQDLQKSRYRLPLSDVAAALGVSQLARYDAFLRIRGEIAMRYTNEIMGRFSRPKGIATRTMHFRYPILLHDDRVPAVMAEFAANGVLAKRGVDALLEHGQSLSAAESAFRHTLSLPIHPSMTSAEIDKVIQVANRLLAE